MSVPEQTPFIEYIANGSTTSFALDFDCDKQDYLIVTLDDNEPPVGSWNLASGFVVFLNAPSNGVKVEIKRNTPFSRSTDYQTYNNSFRPPAVNKDFDLIWWKLQELGVADWILGNRIDALKNYVDDQDDELRAYLMEEIRKQGVALDQLEDYYNYLMQRLAEIAVNGGWEASFVVDTSGKTQQQINDNQSAINSRTVTPYDFGAIGDGIAHPLSERYATLALAKAMYPSATSLGEYIDGHALNVWWRDICANDRKYATCHGDFLVNTKISNLGLNNYLNPIHTKRIDFDAHIKFQALPGNGFEIISPRLCNFSGYIRLEDTGGTVWANRTTDQLMYLEDFIHATFNWRVLFYHAKHLGLEVFSGATGLSGTVTNNNTSNLGDMLFNSCGHRFNANSFSFTSRSDIGGSSTTDQRSVLTLSADHNLGDLVDSFVQSNNKPYLITASTANTVTVYPWLSETDTTGTIRISKGGDFRLRGPDSNNIKMSGGSSNCAICGGQEGFYVGSKMQRTNEANDIGLRLGNSVSNIQVGGTYLGVYFELNVYDVVKTNVTIENAVILNPINLNFSKCHVLAPIDTGSRKPNPTLVNSFSVIYGDKTIGQRKLQYYSGVNPSTTITFKIGEPQFKIRSGAATITLADDANIRRVFGIVDLEFEVFGVATNNGTGANTTIKCEVGYKINGSASDLIIPASNSAFKVSARLVNETDWRVYLFFANKPSGSKTHDWPSLAAGAQQSTTVTVSGAVLGNAAIASMDAALSGTSLNAEVTAANTVTVYHFNPTAAAVDVESGVLTVKLI